MISSKTVFLLPVLVLFALFPFFEGGETSSGLFYFHTVTLLAVAVAALCYSRLWIPKFVVYFAPFLLVLLISTYLSDYRYAAFLKLWDYSMGAVWAILICTLLHENKRKLDSYWIAIFCVGALSSIVSILIHNQMKFGRISASFLNPNDYAVLALMLFCFGLFCLEQEPNRRRKIFIATLSGFILLTIGLSLSRGIFIASLSVAVFAFFRHKPGKAIQILLISLVVISGILAAVRLKYYTDPLQYYRLKIWKSSLKGITENPYLGTGLGMLEYRARVFNFPGEMELGRYARVAQSADNQYVEILAEMGFLGLLSFLFGWFALVASLRKTSARYFYLKLPWLIITVACLFSVPLQNTSVLFLVLFLTVIPISESEQESVALSFQSPGRILIPVGCFLMFVTGCYMPFQAHREFYRAVKSKSLQEADTHLTNAVRYNPYQPYYKFFFLRRIVDSGANLDTIRWLNIVSLLDQAIRMNPVEFEFYLYKGRIFRKLLEKNTDLRYYASAVSSYQAALDFNPYNVFLRLEFASFLHQISRHNLAESEIRKALEAEPAFLNARLLLTEVLLSTNNSEEARKEYSKFVGYHRRYRTTVDSALSTYVRSLLKVNATHQRRIEESMKAGSK